MMPCHHVLALARLATRTIHPFPSRTMFQAASHCSLAISMHALALLPWSRVLLLHVAHCLPYQTHWQLTRCLALLQVAAGSTSRIPGLPDIPVVNTQAALSEADIVILAVPTSSHKAIANEFGHLLSGKVVVDVSNPHPSEDLSVPDKALDDTESDGSTSGMATGCQQAAAELCGVSSKGCAAVCLSKMLPVSPCSVPFYRVCFIIWVRVLK